MNPRRIGIMGEYGLWVNLNYWCIWFMFKSELWVWGDTHTQRYTQTHQYPDSAWLRGRAKWKSSVQEALNLLNCAVGNTNTKTERKEREKIACVRCQVSHDKCQVSGRFAEC